MTGPSRGESSPFAWTPQGGHKPSLIAHRSSLIAHSFILPPPSSLLITHISPSLPLLPSPLPARQLRLSPILAAGEIVRRFMWLLFRLENEHLTVYRPVPSLATTEKRRAPSPQHSQSGDTEVGSATYKNSRVIIIITIRIIILFISISYLISICPLSMAPPPSCRRRCRPPVRRRRKPMTAPPLSHLRRTSRRRKRRWMRLYDYSSPFRYDTSAYFLKLLSIIVYKRILISAAESCSESRCLGLYSPFHHTAASFSYSRVLFIQWIPSHVPEPRDLALPLSPPSFPCRRGMRRPAPRPFARSTARPNGRTPFMETPPS